MNYSNLKILNTLQKALEKNNLSKNCIQLIESKDREDTIEFMNMTEYIDLIVPRGGRGLIDTLVNNSKVPFILDGDGNVHLYIHEDAKEEYMVPIVINSKVQRPGVCNALETLILHGSVLGVIFLDQAATDAQKNGCSAKTSVFQCDADQCCKKEF